MLRGVATVTSLPARIVTEVAYPPAAFSAPTAEFTLRITRLGDKSA